MFTQWKRDVEMSDGKCCRGFTILLVENVLLADCLVRNIIIIEFNLDFQKYLFKVAHFHVNVREKKENKLAECREKIFR